jgi:peptide/nickel transport system substrate-binding protein
MMRKRTLATILTTVSVALLVLSACGAKSADFAAGFKSKDPTTFVVQEISGGPQTLDPALAYDSASGEILQNVYDNLVFYNREKKTELVPMLATEVPTTKNGGISADGKTVTFKIRTGVKFHSGSALTVDDVAYSFQRLVLSAGSNSPAWLFAEPLFGSTGNNDITDQLDPDGSKELIDNRDALKAEDPAAVKALCESAKSKIVADSAANTVTFHLAQPWGPFVITFVGMWGSIQEKAWVAANNGWDG